MPEPKPIAWATIYTCAGREDRVEIGDANPAQERMAETWGWQHRRVPLVEIPADQVLVPRRLLEDIEKTWRIPHPQARELNERAEQAIEEGLHELRALLQP